MKAPVPKLAPRWYPGRKGMESDVLQELGDSQEEERNGTTDARDVMRGHIVTSMYHTKIEYEV